MRLLQQLLKFNPIGSLTCGRARLRSCVYRTKKPWLKAAKRLCEPFHSVHCRIRTRKSSGRSSYLVLIGRVQRYPITLVAP